MADLVRVGILGGGGIIGSHARGYRATAELGQVTVVAEPNPARAETIHRLLGDQVRIVADYHEVLADTAVDAVDIILPHHLHLPATQAAAAAGKPVLVEKVMARNVWECDRMLSACAAAEVSLTVCHDRRYNGLWRKLKTVIDSGALGEVFAFRLDHNQDVVFPATSWARSRDGLGGGAIMSCLTHQIDALRWYGGEVASVTCMTRVVPSRMEGETAGGILARMASGALAELWINWYTRSNHGPHKLHYELAHVTGTDGEAYMAHGEGTFIRLRDTASAAAVDSYGEDALQGFVPVPGDEEDGHTGCIREWLKSLRGEPAKIVTSGSDCRGTVEVAEAAYRAEAEERVVHLPLEPRPWES